MNEAETIHEADAAKAAIVDAVIEELRRVAVAIRGGALGGAMPKLAVRLDRFGGGPELVIDEEDLEALPLAKLLDLLGPNLEAELVDGRISVSSPSWRPDRLPF